MIATPFTVKTLSAVRTLYGAGGGFFGTSADATALAARERGGPVEKGTASVAGILRGGPPARTMETSPSQACLPFLVLTLVTLSQ